MKNNINKTQNSKKVVECKKELEIEEKSFQK